MTAAELMKELEAVQPDAEVMVCDGRGAFIRVRRAIAYVSPVYKDPRIGLIPEGTRHKTRKVK